MPTSLTITSNFAELNKLALQINRTINASNNTELEELSIPYLTEFIIQLRKLGVIILNYDIHGIDYELKSNIAKELNIPKDFNNLYKDTKHIELNLFANKNKFSGIKMPAEYGVSFHATRKISFAGFAQLQRHRTLKTEIEVPEYNEVFVPAFLEPYEDLVKSWIDDYRTLEISRYPQGRKILTSMEGTLKDLITYVGSERACNRAQYEIAEFYQAFLEHYYEALKNKESLNYNVTQYKELIKPYVGVYRCRTKDYKCPTPCPGGPKENRKF